MRRINQRTVAPQVPATCCDLGGIRKIGKAHSMLLVTIAMFTSALSTGLATRATVAADATGITLDNFTSNIQGDDVALTPDAANTFTISESMGQRPLGDTGSPGPNLFHSFFEFGLSAGQIALFTQAIADGSDPISNVISRVTGGMPSTINGTIRSAIDGADFWFINPAGMVFGDQSSIDVSGSFNASAGDFVVLEDGSSFDTLTSNPILTISNPVDFGFLSATSGGTLSLNGTQLDGNVSSALPDSFRGLNLHARELQIDSASAILTNANSPARGDITLTAGNTLDIRGTLGTTTESNRRAGDIALNAGDVVINAADLGSTSEGRGRSGSLMITATDTVDIIDSRLEVSSNRTNSGAAGTVRIEAGGDINTSNTALVAYTNSNRQITDADDNPVVPDVVLRTAGDITMVDSTALSTTFGEANGGSVVLEGQDILLVGDLEVTSKYEPGLALGRALNASSQALLDEGGNAGDVLISGRNITLNDGARATAITAAGGDAGDVTIIASDTFSTNVGIATTSDQVFISSANQGATNYDPAQRGASGDVTIEAGNSIDINNTRLNVQRRSDRPENNANPSKITLSAPNGTVRLNRVNAFTSTTGSNDAGVLSLQGKDVDLTRTTLSSFTNGTGHSGSVIVEGSDSITAVLLRAEAEAGRGNTGAAGSISLSSAGNIDLDRTEIVAGTQGNRINLDSLGNELRGNIRITTPADISLTSSAVVASTLARAAAGDVVIEGRNITIEGALEARSRFASGGERPVLGTGIEVSTKLQNPNAGNGGDIRVIASDLRLSNGAQLLSTTDGTGDAGDIQIEVTGELTSNLGLQVRNNNRADTAVTISSANLAVEDNDRKPELGASGNVTIRAGSLIDLTNTDIFTLRRSSNPDNTEASTLRVEVTDGDFRANEFSLNSSTRGANEGGSLIVNARNIRLENGVASSFTTGEGNSGSIDLNATSGIVLQNTQLLAESSNSTRGAAGSIRVNAGGALDISDSAVVASTQSDRIITDATGEEIRPDITLTSSGDLSLTNSAVLTSTTGLAAAGTISISGADVRVVGKKSFTSAFGEQPNLGEGISASSLGKALGSGDAGNVTITANSLHLVNGATITSNTSGPGNAGSLNIQVVDELITNLGQAAEDNEDNDEALEQVVISSTNLEEQEPDEKDIMGASGNVSIVAGKLVDLRNTQISTLRRSNNNANSEASRVDITVTNGDLVTHGGFITSSTRGDNDAGSVNLTANNINLASGRLSSFTRGGGNSGSVNLTATNNIQLNDLEVLAQSSSAIRGAAGSVVLTAGGTVDISQSDIVASTETNRIRRQNGEQIRPSVTISTPGDITITESAVLASTTARAAAGSINISGDNITINGGRQVNSLFGANADLGNGISASTLGMAANAGDAGDVTIVANNLNLMNGATITSNTGGPGNAGNINIQVAHSLRANEGLEPANTAQRNATRVEISSANLAVQNPDDKFDLGASGNVSVVAGEFMHLTNTRVSALRRSSNDANTSPSEVNLEVLRGDLIADDLEVTSATRGANNGGSVNISAQNIDLTSSNLLSFTTGEGNSGSVRVTTANNFTGRDLTIGVESSNDTKGAAGEISVHTGGNLSLASSAVVAATQSDRVILDQNGNEQVPSVTLSSAGDISLADSAVLTTTVGRAAAGSIQIMADRLTITGTRSVQSSFGSQLALGSGISASTLGKDPEAGDAGTLTVAANHIELSNGASITSTTNGPGNAGDIRIEAANELISNRPRNSAAGAATSTTDEAAMVVISSSNLAVNSPDDKPGLGASGNVSVTAGQLMDVSNTEISALRRSSNPDNTTPSTVQITVTDGDLIANNLTASSATRGANDAGSVVTRARNIRVTDSRLQSFTTGEGNSGSIVFEAAENIVSTRTSFGVESGNTTKGAAGSIAISAGGDIDFTESVAVGATQSNRQILDENGNQRVPRVDINAGGLIALTDSAVLTTTAGGADAGSIAITGDTIRVRGKAAFQSEFGASPELGSGISASTLSEQANAGDAGSVTLEANRIELTEGASITSRTGGSGNAGNITVAARDELITNEGLTFTEADQLSRRVLISSSNLPVTSPDDKFGLGASGTVTVSAGRVIDLNNTEISALRRSSNAVNQTTSEVTISVQNGDLRARDVEFSSATSGANNGGSLEIAANDITIENGILSAFTTGRGNSGSIIINAGGELTGSNLAIEVESSSATKGAAGRVVINTGGALTLDESRVVAATQSNRNLRDASGNTLIPSVNITSGSAVALTNSAVLASALGNAPAGSIRIVAPKISITGSREVISRLALATPLGSGVSASASSGGEAGTVSLLATDELILSNARVSSQSLGTGAAGEIELVGDRISIGDGSQVLASTDGAAAGGQVSITGTRVELSGAQTRVSSNATSTGTGGKVDLNVTDLLLSNGARIETLAVGDGDSGNITINASGDVILQTDKSYGFDARSALLSESSVSQGGSITANVAGELRVNNSRIESSVNGEDGTGGDINISPQALFLTSGQILAQAQQGSGGAINIGRGGNSPAGPSRAVDNGLFIIDSNSIINADSEAGTNGVVAVDSPDINANAVIAEPDARIVATPKLNDSLCSSDSADRSSLVLVNEGGVPPAPDGYLTAPSLAQTKQTTNAPEKNSGIATIALPYSVIGSGCSTGGE